MKTGKLNTLVLSAAASALLAGMAPAQASNAVEFDIQSTDLAAALQQFAIQSGRNMLFSTEAMTGRPVNPVRGALDPLVALDQMLEGSGLAYEVTESGAIVFPAAGDSRAPRARVQETSAAGLRSFAAGTAGGQAVQTASQPRPVPPPSASESAPPDRITIVGTQIRGSRIAEILPVSVFDEEDILATGVSTGDDLFRSIPQAGDVAFNQTRTIGGINDARGDVASINLRGVGTGNTLVLLNGRRMVLHPGTQAENLVPVVSVNTNAIPVGGVSRVEVLRDGASALYGADAVAGVVNTILRQDFEGYTFQARYGGAEASNRRDITLTAEAGFRFNNNQSSLSIFASYTDQTPMFASDRAYARGSDNRALVEGTPFEGVAAFNNTSVVSAWGAFNVLGVGTVTQNGAPVSNAGGGVHVRPEALGGCRASLGDGICLGSTTTRPQELRYDLNDQRTITGGVERVNVFAFLNHEFGNGIEFFGELGGYRADFNSVREPSSPLAAARITIPRTNYWNPFGAVTLPDGSPNPNRLPGLNVPDEGADVSLFSYRLVDAGMRNVNVINENYRVLGGLRGTAGGWDWESAALYSRARTEDTTHRVSSTLFQQALALSTPDAYNPFNGGDLSDYARGDATPSNAAAIASFIVPVSRISETDLGLVDVRLSRPDLFALPAGGVGVGVGAEWRWEGFSDDRDPRLDGTITYTDMVTGIVSGSDVMGTSPTNDSSGNRNVGSLFAELEVPLISPEMNIPLAHSVQVQIAGRYEHYSDVGDAFAPRVAASWAFVDGFSLRAAWSEGFRAPNLPQVYEQGVERSNTRGDFIKCEADVRAGRIADFSACTRSQSVVSSRDGNRDLEPETSRNISIGSVLQANFLPPEWGSLTLTADWWQIKQEGVVGIFGDFNHVALDYLLRTQGSSNPAVVREAPTQEDIDDFAGTGLEPVGRILTVNDGYLNLLPRTIEGFDIGALYRLRGTQWGDFRFSFNAAKLLTFRQEASPEAQLIIDAQQSGDISQAFTVQGANDLIRQGGLPEWRFTSTLSWNQGPWGAGLSMQYVSSVFDTGASLADGTQWKLDNWLTANAHVSRTVETGALEGTRFLVGVRNLTNEDPPLSSSAFGYDGALHSAQGRYWYASVRKSF